MHRQVLAPGAPSTVRVTPRSRTATRAAGTGGRRSAPSRRPTAVGLPAARQAHRTQVADPTGGPAVTVYISRNVEIADLSRDRATTSPPVGAGPADPPLLTHVWRIVFERQAGERDPR
ncbi:multiple cyclophane-containing RiPP AmcA [Micromonospora haikouensis]|uniref:multiple cyclophane-containing RiPP AmcA n=1 Tax=Micromonospora haikouensis TaxID=686309 RepID=UPI003D8FDF53